MISMTISCMSVARYRYVVPLLDPHAPQLPVKPGKSRQIVANETAGPRRSGQTGQRPAGISQARCATISAGRREAAGRGASGELNREARCRCKETDHQSTESGKFDHVTPTASFASTF